AKVVLAEAEVPRALARAMETGHMGFMDYYNMKNIQADTGMRDAIGGGVEGTTTDGNQPPQPPPPSR
ncbi:MAG: flotillin-like FloA family protein, partial [Candidatus Eremiobacteraeota bacterium]|nr:flotillin-like FloA family protein [Candidatus Eremiobacteraeota bacterium]